ncbi:MAG: MBL fold metallo-hydrolase [Candidatus Bathyarchaeota archaeon]|nr:MBL fold metallo-hydrolase [Candidatus Bathyarchaeota archaeon]MCX8162808.1 MBL fold metallo-hydrolase [Candidatus Bathyarchaeota archaeon]
MKAADDVYVVECPFLRPGYFVSSCIIVGRGVVVVDTGVEGSPRMAIYPCIEGLGRRVSDVSYILFTHSHFDHCGGAAEMKGEAMCRVGVHELGKPFLEDPMLLDIQLSRRFPTLFRVGEPRFKPLEVDVAFRDGDVLDANGIRLRMLHTPGHSICSSCIVYEDRGIYICGDSIQGRGGNRPLLFHSSTDYIGSLNRLSEERVEVMVLGHPFPPFGRAVLRGWEVREYIEESLKAIEELKHLVLDVLRGCRKPMDPKQIYEAIAVSQPVTIGCILEDLEVEGRVERFDEKLDLWIPSR